MKLKELIFSLNENECFDYDLKVIVKKYNNEFIQDKKEIIEYITIDSNKRFDDFKSFYNYCKELKKAILKHTGFSTVEYYQSEQWKKLTIPFSKKMNVCGIEYIMITSSNYDKLHENIKTILNDISALDENISDKEILYFGLC